MFVSHEASLTGAPIFLLHFLRWLRANSEVEPHVLLISGGELVADYAALAPVTLVKPEAGDESAWRSLLRRAAWGDPLAWPSSAGPRAERLVRHAARRALVGDIRRRLEVAGAPDLVYLNSTVSARALSLMPPSVPVVTHAHEMTSTLESLKRTSPWAVSQMREQSHRCIAASGPVRSALVDTLGIDPARIVVCHEAIPLDDAPVTAAAVDLARRELGLSPDAAVVGSVGALNWRKAPDLFIQVAKRMIDRLGDRPLQFLWLGPEPPGDGTAEQVRYDLAHAGLSDRVQLIAARADPRPVMALFDVFALTSREDPFPLACLEAAALGKPVVCFDAGGMPEFLEPSERLVIPYLDVEAMAGRIADLLDSDAERAALGRALALRVRERHTIDSAAPILLEVIRRTLAEVAA